MAPGGRRSALVGSPTKGRNSPSTVRATAWTTAWFLFEIDQVKGGKRLGYRNGLEALQPEPCASFVAGAFNEDFKNLERLKSCVEHGNVELRKMPLLLLNAQYRVVSIGPHLRVSVRARVRCRIDLAGAKRSCFRLPAAARELRTLHTANELPKNRVQLTQFCMAHGDGVKEFWSRKDRPRE